MTRLKYYLFALFALLIITPNIDACQRCGLFGNKCRYAPTYYAPKYYAPAAAAVYVPPSNTQNFVFNNTFPFPALGNTVYGAVPSYSQASAAYSFDAAAVLDRSARLAELAFEAGGRAAGDHAANVSGALALADSANRRQSNTLLALAGIQANTAGGAAASALSATGGTNFSFRATVQNGQLSLQRLDQQGLASVLSCARCHDGVPGPKKPPKDLIYDGHTPISNDHFRRAADAIMAGTMPPNSELTIEQRSDELAELAKLLIK